MNLDEQKNLVKLVERYNKLDSGTIKERVIKCIDKSAYNRKSAELAQVMEVDIQTIYLWRQPQKQTTISFESLLKLATVLEIPVRQLIEPDYLEEEFKYWLKNTVKLGDDTIDNYISALHVDSNFLNLGGFCSSGIFSIRELSVYDRILEKLTTYDEFVNKGRRYKNQHLAALKKYREFLEINAQEAYHSEISLEGESRTEIQDPTIKNSNNKEYSKNKFLSEVFFSEEEYDTLVNLLKRKKNIILQGPTGVGKTFAAKRLAYSIMGEENEQRVKLVQFHQSYSYEDFIMGYRPNDTGFSIKYGSFYMFCKLAQMNPNQPYFFIIDEINRGNLSKIFGELLMLIESDKRGQKMDLIYEDSDFFVPENLYVIGTMNTADRSLAFIDYALRRRFCFFELKPAYESDSFKNFLLENSVQQLLVDKIVNKLSTLNNRISEDSNLGSGFRIGHSYFCDCGLADDKWFENIVRYEIAPLLDEYWIDDPETGRQLSEELLG